MIMKKLLAVMLLAALMTNLAACGQKPETGAAETESAETETLPGGWIRGDSPVVTDEVKELLDKALEGLVGAKYIPVAYLGRQIVSGTNHAILCRVAPVVPDPKESYCIVTVYVDLSGKAQILEVRDFETETNIREGVMGGWSQAESPEITEDLRAVFDKAAEGLVGVDYDPIALVSSQVVAGMNYCFLCEAKAVAPGAESSCALVTVCADLNGGAEITGIVMLPEAEPAE